MPLRPVLFFVTALPVILIVVGCGGSTDATRSAGRPALLSIVSGDAQSATVGTELAAPVVVRVTDADGDAVANQVVNFRVTAGAGSAFAGVALTNPSGEARERWTLGKSAGAQSLEARAVDANSGDAIVFATFQATAMAGPAAKISKASADIASIAAGSAVLPPPSALVVDQFDNPVSGVSVSFAVTTGGGSISGGAQSTNASGLATVGGWTLGNAPGANVLTAAAGSLAGSPVAFTATGTVGTAASMTLSAGDAQSVPAGTALPLQPSVKVVDGVGNPVGGMSVTFAVTGGGGSVTGAAATTGTDGIAAVGQWQLGLEPGSNTLAASVTGLVGSPVTFTASGVATPAAALALTVPAAGAAAGAAFVTQPQITVRNALGFRVTGDNGRTITMTVATGGTVVGTATSQTTNGIATFSNIGIAGPIRTYTLTFGTSGLASAAQTIALAAGAAATITVNPTTATLTDRGTITVTATSRDGSGNVATSPITWTSSNTAAATVVGSAATAVVTAGAVGTTTIEAASNGQAASVAVVVSPTAQFSKMAAGMYYTCALTSVGVPYCWGTHGNNVLGSPATTDASRPLAVSAGFRFASMSGSGTQMCGLTSGGEAYCWGMGARGDGSSDHHAAVPTKVAVSAPLSSVSANGTTNCGVSTTGTLYCWGSSGIGDGAPSDTPRLLPVAIGGGTAFATVFTSVMHSCALTATGVAYCWGDNRHGEIGDGSTTERLVPVPVAGGLAFSTLALGINHTCGVATSGQTYCWGSNEYGALGIGSPAPASEKSPVAIQGGLTFVQMTASGSATCGVTASGSAYCWGINEHYALGNGTQDVALAPRAVAGGLVFAGVTMGSAHACGWTTSGLAYCWGRGDAGQIGNGTVLTWPTPVGVLPP